jgi:DNA-binding response OmpR family regulator
MKILICEESPTLALDLWWLLHEQGHSVCGIARSRLDGLEKVARSEPDLVMVDEDFEGHRGRDLVEALSRSDVPAVIISEQPQWAAGSTSARAVLAKPFSEAALASVMARVDRPLGARATTA